MAVANSLSPDASQETTALQERIPTLRNRTSAEITEARRRVFALSPEPRALPLGKTLEDVIVGQWPGGETDEEIAVALREIS